MGSGASDSKWSLDNRLVINAAIILLSLALLLLAGGVGWHAWRDYQTARDISLAHAVAGDFLEAATWRALERTYTDAALGARGRPAAVRPADIAQARKTGDAAWQRALTDAKRLADGLTAGAELEGKLLATASAHGGVQVQRAKVDACMAGRPCAIDLATWHRAIGELIRTSALAREAAFLSLDNPQQVGQLHLLLRRSAWTVNEHARQTRGLIAYHLAAGAALGPGTGAELAQLRGIVTHSMENLLILRQARQLDRRVTTAIEAAGQALAGGFWPLEEAVLADAGDLDAAAWLERTQPAMDALRHLNAAVGGVIAERAEQTRLESRENLYEMGLLLLATAVLTLVSLTKVRQTANALFHQKELAEVTIRSIGDAVITTDVASRVEYLNPVAERMTGWNNQEARGRPLREVFNIVDGIHLQPQTNPMETCLRENRVVGLDNNTVLIRRDGGRHFIEDSAAPIRDREGRLVGGVLVFYDTTEAHQAGHLIAYHSTHDSLTGLINRREFEHRLAALLAHASAHPDAHALMYMDLDQFKVINDTCSHRAGDQLMRQVSQTLRNHVRDNDLLARLGGDEFGLLVEHCSLERAVRIAESIRAAVAEFQFTWEDSAFDVRLSIGLVPFAGGGLSPAELLGQADAACHAAKDKGRDRIQVYESGDLDMARRHGEMRWVARITKALAEDRFQLFCQPIRPLVADGRRHGEVLVRMLDEDGRLIPPGDFIPPAERYGLMPALDRWVVRNALRALGERHRAGAGEQAGILAINLSGATLGDEDIEPFLRGQMALAGVPTSALCFEVTETAAVANLGEAAYLIRALQAAGCHFALDDFGSGMSSFMYLKQLPVNYLKIDGSFVRNIVGDPVSLAMVQSIHAVGKAMGIHTIAEYVENDAILRRLENLGVEYAQGYAVGRPEPLDRYLAGTS